MFRRVVCIFLVSCSLYASDSPLRDRNEPYKIQPSDQLQLTYRYTPEYNQSLTVQPDGMVTIDLVGSIKIGDLTLDQARATILEQLQTRLNDPEITLILTDFVRPSYTVVGHVGAPGKFELHGPLTALQAIAIAGGFKDSAKHSQVILFRRDNNDIARTRILNLKSLMNPKHPHLEEDVAIEPGDLLVIPKNQISKIADYVHWVSVGTYIPLW